MNKFCGSITPIMLAMEDPNKIIIGLLILHGANLNDIGFFEFRKSKNRMNEDDLELIEFMENCYNKVSNNKLQ